MIRPQIIYADLCDWCNEAAPLGQELHRCSQCVVARYCCKEQQRAAWKGDEDRRAHKEVCVAAKKAAWAPST